MTKLTCTKCGKAKPDAEFRPAPKNKLRRGLASWCRDCERAAARAYKAKHPQKSDPAYHRAYWQQTRADAVTALGGGCCRCGEDDPMVLQIDHVNGDGYQSRRIGKKSGAGYTILRRIINGETNDFQLLCANCHSKKTRENGEHLRR